MTCFFRSPVLWLSMLLMVSCQQQIEKPEDAVARFDDHWITLTQFRQFYELDPNFGLDSSGYGALRDELVKLLDHYRAYKKAEQTGLLDDSMFVKARNWEKRAAMLRQFYREKISSQIEITEEELRQEFLKVNIKLHPRHLFTDDSEEAHQLYRRLQAGESFETLAAQVFEDTLLSRNGGDLGWVKAGDLDDEFSNAALNLNKGEISPPVQTRWGYHIIQLLDRKEQVMVTESVLNAQRSSLEKRIRRKKSRRLANRYITDVMADLNPQPNPQKFRRLWNAVVPKDEREKSELSFKVSFTNELIERASQKLQLYLQEPLIEYQNGSVSIGEYLNALKTIPLSNRPRFQTPHQLSNQIGIWIRDELLHRESRRLGLSDHPRVKREIRDFLNQQTYLYYLQEEIARIDTPEPVRRYFEKKDRTVLKEFPELSRFHTLQGWKWSRGENRLHTALKSIAADIEIDFEKLTAENESIDWQGRIRMFAIRKPY